MSTGEAECDHYGDQVAVTLYDLSNADSDPCAWCGDEATVGLLKSQRHELGLCDDCKGVLGILLDSPKRAYSEADDQ